MKSAMLKPSEHCISNSNFLSVKGTSFEIRLLIILLFILNLGLLKNIPATNLAFNPVAVSNGEWWRMFTWPFVHVSRYHLLIDGSAFLFLYSGLFGDRFLQRISYLFSTAVGALLLPLAISPELSQTGLCGLSGIAHGLMIITALDLLGKTDTKKIGWVFLFSLLIKTSWELATGSVLLQQWHLGDIGHPIVATHAGGIIGGLLSYGCFFLLRLKKDNAVAITQPESASE